MTDENKKTDDTTERALVEEIKKATGSIATELATIKEKQSSIEAEGLKRSAALETSIAELKTKVAAVPDGGFSVGKSDKDRVFRMERAIAAMYYDRVEYRHDKAWSMVDGGYERDVIEAERASRTQAQIELTRAGGEIERQQVVGTPGDGGFLVPAVWAGFDDMLRNALVVYKAGAFNFPSNAIPFYWNSQTGASTGAYLSGEIGTLGSSKATFTQKAASPRYWGHYVPISRIAIKTMNPSIADIVRTDLLAVAAQNRQNMILQGTNTGGQPGGIISAPASTATSGGGIGHVTLAATTLAILNTFWGTVEKANGLVNPSTAAFISSPGVRNKYLDLLNTAGAAPMYAQALAGGPGNIPAFGYPWYTTAALSSTNNQGQAAFGCWDMVGTVDWGQEVLFSQEVLWTTQQVALGILDYHEVLVRRTASFVQAANSTTL